MYFIDGYPFLISRPSMFMKIPVSNIIICNIFMNIIKKKDANKNLFRLMYKYWNEYFTLNILYSFACAVVTESICMYYILSSFNKTTFYQVLHSIHLFALIWLRWIILLAVVSDDT